MLSAVWRDTRFWWEQLKEREQLEGLGVNARIILKWIISNGWKDVKWINLAEGREKWLAVVNAVMNIRA
jgi:hypothetical protein